MRALFLDLDGTVRQTLSGAPCPNSPEDQEVLPGRFAKIWAYKNMGYKIIAVTNQGGVGLGIMTKKECEVCLHDLNKKLGDVFDDMMYDPAAPHRKDSFTKPNPGMLFAAQEKFKLDLKRSIMVGDRSSDRMAAERRSALPRCENFF